MKKKIFAACIFSAIATQNIFPKNNLSEPSLDPAIETYATDDQLTQNAQIQEEKIPTIDELNKKVHGLSNQLGKVLAKVKNEKDKKILVKLVQKIQAAEDSEKTTSSSNKIEPKNNRTLRTDLFDMLKNLTSPWAFVAYAVIICSYITKGALDSGQIVLILNSLKNVIERFVSLGEIIIIGPIILYIIQTISYYTNIESAQKSEKSV